MLRNQKLLLVIPAIVLIPILLGITPLHFIQKIGAGCPFSDGKQILKCNHSLFNSIISQDDPTIVSLNSAPLDQESTPAASDIEVLDPDPLCSNITFSSFPLRC
jgi:hypothetical protein